MGSPCILLMPGAGRDSSQHEGQRDPSCPWRPVQHGGADGRGWLGPHTARRGTDLPTGPARHRCAHTWLAPCSRLGSTPSQWQVRVWAPLADGPYGLPPGAPAKLRWPLVAGGQSWPGAGPPPLALRSLPPSYLA